MSVAVSTVNKSSVQKRFKDIDFKNSHAIASSARKGVNPAIFYNFAATIKMPEKVLAGILNISARTVSNYRDQHKTLAPVYSEHLLKLMALYNKGEEIFGNIDEFNYWLKKPLWKSDETPMHWLITHGGIDLLMEELDKLAQGYPV